MLPDLRERVRATLGRAKTLLWRAFSEEHTTEEVAQSFSLGVFITMLPTLGTGFLAFVALAAVVDRLSKLALVASAVVFNPVVKWGVYGLSVGLGFFLLGPVEGVSMSEVSLNAAPEVVLRLVVGNTILAILAAVPSYFVAYRVVDNYRANEDGRLRQFARRVGIATDGGEDSGTDVSSGTDNA
ncbi:MULTISPECIES: DUF2062 domain-containing protein [Salinibaculum]|uniref:DUF2062 domain-containing protein n=1 Tax=Salinibaculum TaxID=2732368 RepID=UPI0030CFEFE7